MATLKSFSQFSRTHESFSEGSLRWMFFCSKEGRKDSRGKSIEPNGLAKAFVKIGRRVYIKEEMFFNLVEAINSDRVGNPVSNNLQATVDKTKVQDHRKALNRRFGPGFFV